MAIRYPKEVHEFIQANYYGRRPEELAVLVNKKFSSGYTPAQMKSYVKNYKRQYFTLNTTMCLTVQTRRVIMYLSKK